MNQTIKNFWANRRQNAWIVVEIALVAVLSFYFLDYFVVSYYDTHLCRPDCLRFSMPDWPQTSWVKVIGPAFLPFASRPIPRASVVPTR